MIVLNPDTDVIFKVDSELRMQYEKSIYRMRTVLLDFLKQKGIHNYNQFENLMLEYFPNMNFYDIALFWEGISFKEYVIERVSYIINIAVDRVFFFLKYFGYVPKSRNIIE